MENPLSTKNRTAGSVSPLPSIDTDGGKESKPDEMFNVEQIYSCARQQKPMSFDRTPEEADKTSKSMDIHKAEAHIG